MYKPLNKLCSKQHTQKTYIFRFLFKQMLHIMLFGLDWLGWLDGTKLPLSLAAICMYIEVSK